MVDHPDRAGEVASHALRGRRSTTGPRLGAVNYIRTPLLASGLLLLLFFPGIIRQGQPTYLAATGLTQQPFLSRWLLITAILLATSAITYAIRLRVTHPNPTPTPD